MLFTKTFTGWGCQQTFIQLMDPFGCAFLPAKYLEKGSGLSRVECLVLRYSPKREGPAIPNHLEFLRSSGFLNFAAERKQSHHMQRVASRSVIFGIRDQIDRAVNSVY